MADVSEVFSRESPSASTRSAHVGRADTGGFSGFVIKTFEAIIGLLFFAVWLGIFGLAFAMAQGMTSYGRMSSQGVLLIVGGLVIGFVAAVCSTGLVVVLLDMRRQLVEIRKSLSKP